MKLASFNLRGRPGWGVVVDDARIIDVRQRLPRYHTLLDVLRADAMDEVREAIFAGGVTPPVDIVTVDGGDHSFAVLKSSGREPSAVHAEIQDGILRWVSAQLVSGRR